jgi:hypothetical protein
MLTVGSLAFSGLINLGLLIWRISRLIERKVIQPIYDDSGMVITKKGASDIKTHDRRAVWATLSLFAQHLLLLVPMALVLGGIRFKNWAHMDGGAVTIGILALGIFALHRAHSRVNPNQRSGRGVFTYKLKLVDSLAWVGLLFLIAGAVNQIYWLWIPAFLCVVAIFTHVGMRSSKAVKEFREDNPGDY